MRWTLARDWAVAAILVFCWRHYEELRERHSVRTADWVLAVVLGFAVFAAWIHLDSPYLAFTREEGFDPWRAGEAMPIALVLRFLAITFAVPVMEELFWRSFLMRWIDARNFLKLDPHRVSLKAIAVTSILFATEHSLWFAGLLAGIAYAGLYVRTGNLRVPLLSHAVTNGALATWIVATGNWQYW